MKGMQHVTKERHAQQMCTPTHKSTSASTEVFSWSQLMYSNCSTLYSWKILCKLNAPYILHHWLKKLHCLVECKLSIHVSTAQVTRRHSDYFLSNNVCVLTAAVFGDPADGGRQTVDVEMLAIKMRALFFPEILPPSRTWLSVARAELHPATHTELPTISGPKVRKDASQKRYSKFQFKDFCSCLTGVL